MLNPAGVLILFGTSRIFNNNIMKKLLCAAVMMPLALMALSQEATPSSGFHVEGTKLLDAKNNEFVMRGCNYSYAWQRDHEETVIPAAKRIGCNAIRLQLSTGIDPNRKWQRCSAEDVIKLIRLCEENELICILNTHDETGDDDIESLMTAVDFWIEMKDILNAHLNTVIVNISNEWVGAWDSWKWKDGYLQAIPALREAGIKNTLMVDCAGWGQYPQSITDAGQAVADSDPDRNMVFSVHMYQIAGSDPQKVRDTIWNVLHKDLSRPIPLVIGEYAYEHQGESVAWQEIQSYSYEQHVGILAWSWTGNGEGAEACDMFNTFDDSGMAQNGVCTILGPYGIKETAKVCSLFDDTVPADCADYNPFAEIEIPDDGPELDDSNSTLRTDLLANNINYNVASWDTESYHFPKELLGGIRKGDKLHLNLTNNGGGQIQAYYATPYSDHNNIGGSYINLADGTATHTIEVGDDRSLRDGLNHDGLYVKGQNYTVNGLSLEHRVRTVSGIDVPSMVESEDIDFEMPYEIYTMDGRRVNTMLPGNIYILRQGSIAVKYRPM